MTIFNSIQRTTKQTDYCDMVDRLAAEHLNEEISNGMPEHAAYLISKLFEIADHKVRLYSDRLKHIVTPKDREDDGLAMKLYGHNSVVEKISEFLSKEGTELEIVVENNLNDLTNHPLINKISNMEIDKSIKGKFSLKKLDEDTIKYLENNEYANHFMIVDESAYRFEVDSRQTSYKAFANFGDSGFAKTLADFFDRVHLANSTEIEIN